MQAILEHHWFSNAVVAALLLGSVALSVFVHRNELWRGAARELGRRRPVALGVLAVYVGIGLADSVAWVDGRMQGEDVVSAHQPRSAVERAFGGRPEKTYSRPFAGAELYGTPPRPLAFPGRHPLGTDILGRDTLLLTLRGVRVALLVGGLTSLIAIPLALLFGVSAGYFGRRVDDVVFFVMSTLASIPGILLLIALVMALGQGTLQVCLALAVTSWVSFCRIARGETMKLRELDYVHAARLMGVSEVGIVWRHVLPNLMHLVVITFVLMFSGQVLVEAVLAWLGIGAAGSWGQMIAQAKDELSREPVVYWNVLAAGAGMFVLLLAINSVGDAIRDILDPRTRRERE
ncbi:MAG: ABC transporter permease [Polyangiaceae bacterium]|nr:ABC transporter permease [Polyangiaceae bacterium]